MSGYATLQSSLKKARIKSTLASVICTSSGSSGLPTLGTALQQLRVNAGATALEYFTPTTNPMTTLGDLIVGGTVVSGAATPIRLAIGGANTVLHGGSTAPSYSAVVEADITLANNTTNNVSTSAHGFVPVLPNDATKFLNGIGAWAVPSSSGITGTLVSGRVTLSSGTSTVTDDGGLIYTSRILTVGTGASGTDAVRFGASTSQIRCVQNTGAFEYFCNSTIFPVIYSNNTIVITGNISNSDIKYAPSAALKISFWNATPIVQPTTTGAAATFVANTSAIANDTATFDGYTLGQVVKAMRNIGFLA
jgi:hypothetical protein